MVVSEVREQSAQSMPRHCELDGRVKLNVVSMLLALCLLSSCRESNSPGAREVRILRRALAEAQVLDVLVQCYDEEKGDLQLTSGKYRIVLAPYRKKIERAIAFQDEPSIQNIWVDSDQIISVTLHLEGHNEYKFEIVGEQTIRLGNLNMYTSLKKSDELKTLLFDMCRSVNRTPTN